MKNGNDLRKFCAAAMAVSIAAVSVFAPGQCLLAYGAESTTDISTTQAQAAIIAEETDATVIKDRVIAHGGGIVEGYETTNSEDAVRNAIANGYRYIELDIDLSADGKIIMIHDWDRTAEHYFGHEFKEKLTEAEFSKILVNGNFKTLTFDKLTTILEEAAAKGNTDMRIVTDTKGDNVQVLTALAEQYPQYMNYIIPQIYDYDEYEPVKALGYGQVFFTLYMLDSIDYNQLTSFVRNNDIGAVIIGTDYVVKNLQYKLSSEGIKVYCHPVNEYEEAKQLLDRGVYGVYSSTILPEEMSGKAAQYYLMQTSAPGIKIKLTDVKLNAFTADYVRSISLHGIYGGELLHYEIDGKTMDNAAMEQAENGLHQLTIEIYKGGEKPYTTLRYSLWKGDEYYRLVDKKYEYRLKELKPLADFSETMEATAIEKVEGARGLGQEGFDRIKEILSESLIVKKSEYYYYNNGILGTFKVEDELLNAQSYTNGMVATPLADAVIALGAESITMDNQKYIYITFGDSKIITQSNAYYVYKGLSKLRMKTTVEIYRRKALVSAEFLKFATGRPYLDNEDVMVMLPKGTELSEREQEVILNLAIGLYA